MIRLLRGCCVMADELSDLKQALAAQKDEIDSLAGEVLALSSILFFVLFHMVRNSPDSIRLGLDDAARVTEDAAISAGKAASPKHIVKALGIVEHFYRYIFPNAHKKPT